MIETPRFTPYGLGTSRIASLGKRISVAEAGILISQAHDLEVRVIDTSDTYGSGDSERLIGKVLQGKRDEYFIITKAGFPHMALPEAFYPLNQIGKKIYQKLNRPKNFSSEYLVTALRKSLKRLHTDHVDAFLLHEPTYAELNKYPDFYEGLRVIKELGLASYIGISTFDPDAYKLAADKGSLDIVQAILPYSNTNESSVFQLAKKEGLPVVANAVLRAYPVLQNDERFHSLLENNGLSKHNIPEILVSYARYDRKADCVLIGTKNPDHLRQAVTEVGNSNSLNAIYTHLRTLSL